VAAQATSESVFNSPAVRAALPNIVKTLDVGSLGEETRIPIVGTLAVLGLLTSLSHKRFWILPSWTLAILVLDAHSGSTFSTVPKAMLAGIAVSRWVLRAAQRMQVVITAYTASRMHLWMPRRGWSSHLLEGLVSMVLIGYAAGSVVHTAGSDRADGVRSDARYLVSLTPPERAAMAGSKMRRPWIAHSS